MVIVNPETKGPLGDSHLGEVSAGYHHLGGFCCPLLLELHSPFAVTQAAADSDPSCRSL